MEEGHGEKIPAVGCGLGEDKALEKVREPYQWSITLSGRWKEVPGEK